MMRAARPHTRAVELGHDEIEDHEVGRLAAPQSSMR